MEDQIVDGLLQLHEIHVPPTLLEEQTQYQLESEKERWIRQGGALEEWTQQEASILTKIRPECEKQLKWSVSDA